MVLPQPDSPHQAHRAARLDRERDPVHGAHRADAAREDRTLHEREVLHEVGDLDGGGHVGAQRRDLTERLGPGEDVGPRQGARGDLAGTDAGGDVVGNRSVHLERGLDVVTRVDRDRAACRERAALRQCRKGRRASLERHEPLRTRGLHVRHRAQKPHRVRHVRVVEDLVDRAALDELAGVHHGDAVRVPCDHAEVVRDQHDGGARHLTGLLQHLEDLRLDGHVQSGGRLIRDDHARVVRDRHGDHGALAHTARELVRVRAGPTLGIRDADELEQLDAAGVRRRSAQGAVMQSQPLGDLVAHRVDGGQRRQRILEHHRELGAADLGELAVVHAEERAPVVEDVALDLRVRGQQPHHRER
ncbi:hypothetical protein QE418_000247 [Microbacterium testaceum]|nr:hypothetical protein [Microbacterium testaceum]